MVSSSAKGKFIFLFFGREWKIYRSLCLSPFRPSHKHQKKKKKKELEFFSTIILV